MLVAVRRRLILYVPLWTPKTFYNNDRGLYYNTKYTNVMKNIYSVWYDVHTHILYTVRRYAVVVLMPENRVGT